MDTVILTGITGQVGSFLAEQLLDDGCKVYGLIRKASNFNTQRIDHLYNNSNLELVYGDLTDFSSLASLVGDVKPDYFYNMGAFSHVGASFKMSIHVADVTGIGVIRCLEALRLNSPKTRFLQASTSEIFGDQPSPQNENTKIDPRSPYACAKAMGYYATINYREAYGMFCANAITFNTESYRRNETYLPRKVTRAASRIKVGLQDKLIIGSLTPRRDWNHVLDQIKAIEMIIKADKPDEYCIASGESHSVQEFCEIAFNKVGLNWQNYVISDPKYFRPSEVPDLRGDSTKIKEKLGWKPKYTFDDLVQSMIDYDLELALKEKVDNFKL